MLHLLFFLPTFSSLPLKRAWSYTLLNIQTLEFPTAPNFPIHSSNIGLVHLSISKLHVDRGCLNEFNSYSVGGLLMYPSVSILPSDRKKSAFILLQITEVILKKTNSWYKFLCPVNILRWSWSKSVANGSNYGELNMCFFIWCVRKWLIPAN